MTRSGIITTLVVVFFAILAARLIWKPKDDPIARAKEVISSARPVINAIIKYEQEKGELPESLRDLTPLYLSSIPKAANGQLIRYETRPDQREKNSIVWYDLGMCDGSSSWSQAYSVGGLNNSILVLGIDGHGIVIDAYLDRMPEVVLDLKFDRHVWLNDKTKRIQMVRSLMAKETLLNKALGEVTSMLNEPDGEKELFERSWFLSIYFYWGVMDSCMLQYESNQTNSFLNRCHHTKIEDWKYIHF